MIGSNLENGFCVNALSKAAKSECADGFRLARVIAKSAKDGTKKLDESKGVFVPLVTLSAPFAAEFESLNAAFFDAFEGWQDKQITALVESGKSVIYAADLTLEKLNAFIGTQPEGLGKLSADKIKEWFTADLAEGLRAAFSEKLGDSADEEKITQILNSYRDIFATLARKSPEFPAKTLENLNKAIVHAKDSPMSEKVAEKLSKATVISADIEGL